MFVLFPVIDSTCKYYVGMFCFLALRCTHLNWLQHTYFSFLFLYITSLHDCYVILVCSYAIFVCTYFMPYLIWLMIDVNCFFSLLLSYHSFLSIFNNNKNKISTDSLKLLYQFFMVKWNHLFIRSGHYFHNKLHFKTNITRDKCW